MPLEKTADVKELAGIWRGRAMREQEQEPVTMIVAADGSYRAITTAEASTEGKTARAGVLQLVRLTPLGRGEREDGQSQGHGKWKETPATPVCDSKPRLGSATPPFETC